MARRAAAADELRRIDTVGTAFGYFATVLVVLVAGTLVLGELGISVAPILATAGEDQIREGDVVEIAGKAGEVEEVTLRYIRLRDGDGYVHFVPNGEIKVVVNRTRSHAYAVLDAAISGHQDVEPAYAAMREVGEALRKDPRFGPVILADLQIFGIERWELWGLALRCRIKVLPHEKDTVRRELTRRLLAAFEARAIRTP